MEKITMSTMNSLFAQVDSRKGKNPISKPLEETLAPTVAPEPIAPEPEVTLDPAPADTSNDPTSESDPYEKRFKDLQSFKDKQLSEYQDKIRNLEENLIQASTTPVELPKTQEEIEKFKEDNKDLYDSIQTMIKMDLIETDKELTSKLEKLTNQHNELTTNQKELDLLKEHSDAKSLKNSSEFKTWYASQPNGIKSLFSNEASVSDWSAGFDFYKKTLSKQNNTAAAASSVLDNSIGQTTIQKPIFRESDIVKASQSDPKWYENNYKEIKEAQRDGRLILDISKKQ